MTFIKLQDPAAGTWAEIAPEQGFNCFRWVANLGGQPLEVLWSEDGFAEGGKRASRSGIPILFPFPGRIPGTSFEWEGKTYALEPSDPFGNAIHGFVHTRPWRVLEQSPQHVVVQFQASVDDSSLAQRWPSDFSITAIYALTGNQLSTTYRMENCGNEPLPCGLGTHAYFRLPADLAARNRSVVKIPASTYWELHDMLPTGRVLPVENREAIQQGEVFEKLSLDHVFSGLDFRPTALGEVCQSSITYGDSQGKLVIEFDRSFSELVVYNPPHREAICLEPYSSVPSAFYLEKQGIKTGLRVLQPQETWETTIVMRVEPTN